jgi:hypothetical protein
LIVSNGTIDATIGAALRSPGSRLARVFGAGIGAVVGGYFAVAAGEQFTPGTMHWACVGVAYAALSAIPAAALLGGLIGLVGPRLRDGQMPLTRAR